jgi:hypothetical protein
MNAENDFDFSEFAKSCVDAQVTTKKARKLLRERGLPHLVVKVVSAMRDLERSKVLAIVVDRAEEEIEEEGVESIFCEICWNEVDRAEEDVLCPRCRECESRYAWREETSRRVEELAKEHGWEVDGISRGQTGNRYITLSTPCNGEDQSDHSRRVLRVFVSNHPLMSCEEYISITMHPCNEEGTEDSTLEHLVKRLKNS